MSFVPDLNESNTEGKKLLGAQSNCLKLTSKLRAKEKALIVTDLCASVKSSGYDFQEHLSFL